MKLRFNKITVSVRKKTEYGYQVVVTITVKKVVRFSKKGWSCFHSFIPDFIIHQDPLSCQAIFNQPMKPKT